MMEAWTIKTRPQHQCVFAYTRVNNKHEDPERAVAGAEKVLQLRNIDGYFRDDANSDKRFLMRPAATRLNSMLKDGDLVIARTLAHAFLSIEDVVETLDKWLKRRVSFHVFDWAILVCQPKDLFLLKAALEMQIVADTIFKQPRPLEQEALAKLLATMRNNGMSWNSVRLSLNRQRITTPWGNSWTFQSLQSWVARAKKQGLLP